MDEWVNEGALGKGTFGSVFAARSRVTGEKIAVKQMHHAFTSWEGCVALPEVKCLQKLSHRNIVKLKKVVRDDATVFLLYEFMDGNLLQYLRQVDKQKHGPMPVDDVVLIVRQIASAVQYMHERGFFHRDIKPENILISSNAKTVKVADLGQAREISSNDTSASSREANLGRYSPLVSTRWYRAPEVILEMPYGPAVDMWAIGVIAAEMLTLQVLMPGESDIDQLACIFRTLGTPTDKTWLAGIARMKEMNLTTREYTSPRIHELLKLCPGQAVAFIMSCLAYNPLARLTARAALQAPFLASMPAPKPPMTSTTALMKTTSAIEQKSNEWHLRTCSLIEELDAVNQCAAVLSSC